MPAVPFVLPPRRRLLGVLAAVAALVSIVVAGMVVVPSLRAAATPQTTVDLKTAAHFTTLAGTYFDDSENSFYPQDSGTSSSTEHVTTGAGSYYGGPVRKGDPESVQANKDLVAAYNSLAGLSAPQDHEFSDIVLKGKTITPGVWHTNVNLSLAGTMTFDAQLNPDAVFIIQADYLNTSDISEMDLINGANPANIFWNLSSYAGVGKNSLFVGTIIANGYITIDGPTTFIGRAFSTNSYMVVTNTNFGSAFPTPTADTVTTGQGVAVSFNVLANDGVIDPLTQKKLSNFLFSRAKLSENPVIIGGAASPTPAAPTIGGVSCNATTGDCTYQSPASYVGTDGFDYTLADMGETWNVHVSITVTALDQTPVLRNDRLVATTGGSDVIFYPLANDSASMRDPAAPSLINFVVTQPTKGNITCLGATCTYSTPKDGFTGTVTGAYTAKGATATITIFVDPVALQPTGFTDTKNTVATVPVGTWATVGSTPTIAATCSSGRPVATVTWATVAGTTTWLVQRRYVASSSSSSAPWVTVAIIPATSPLSFTDSLLGEGNSYQWQVRPDLHRWAGGFSPSSVSTTTSVATTAGGCT